MKRMISQKLINNLVDLLNNISSGVFAPNKIALGSVEDLEIADLGALFPTAENGKFLAWNDGVLANVDGGTKLYRHIIMDSAENSSIEIITNFPTPIELSLGNGLSVGKRIGGGYIFSIHYFSESVSTSYNVKNMELPAWDGAELELFDSNSAILPTDDWENYVADEVSLL